MRFPFLVFLLCHSVTFAAEKRKTAHREHEAHVHGGGTLEIAFDCLVGKMEFRVSAEAIVGFEHQPVKDKDKKTFEDTRKIFENDIGKMVAFAGEIKCISKLEVIELSVKSGEDLTSSHISAEKKEVHGEHSDFFTRYAVKCEKPLRGTEIKIDFAKFKKLKDLDITVLAGDLQKSAEYKGKIISIEMK